MAIVDAMIMVQLTLDDKKGMELKTVVSDR